MAAALAKLPLTLLGLAISAVLLLTMLLGLDANLPGLGSHSSDGVALQKDWWAWVQVFLAVVVAAPLVEEVLFRGVLYRHLREATRGLRVALSVALSVLVSGFVFAVIHPQGWLGVPLLMVGGTVYALAREWSDSLVPPLVAHALNNLGITLGLLLFLA